VEPLTRRQREVASLVIQGLTNREIEERLVLSEPTAEGHIEQIRHKLGVRSRTQIVAWVLADRRAGPAATDSPEIRYARAGDGYVAYQVFGLDSADMLAFSSGMLPIDSMNDEPSLTRFHDRLASFSRLIRFDLRGVGMSDPAVPSSPPTLEQWIRTPWRSWTPPARSEQRCSPLRTHLCRPSCGRHLPGPGQQPDHH
jgi:DNA-binding CsgD family transcriptional regulator